MNSPRSTFYSVTPGSTTFVSSTTWGLEGGTNILRTVAHHGFGEATTLLPGGVRSPCMFGLQTHRSVSVCDQEGWLTP